MAVNYKQCPKCGSKSTLKILYGMPTYEAFEKAEAGEIKLGGCCIIEGAPDYYCKDCECEWSRQQAIDHAYGKIKALRASVGGYFGGYYNVEIDLIRRKVTWSHWGSGIEEPVQKTIRSGTAKELLKELKSIDILNWKAKYIEPGVRDGTQWSLEVIRDGKKIMKYGDNKFPDEWESFCRLISKVTGRKFR